ncbi:MAG: arsenate reductase ArsC [Planctomycetes bacterium]|nr:arsenate reductase ArsC [Planctomycetota bacterium]
MSDKRRVLFLCTGNCCRSPMAEALLRRIGGERFEACSAGSQPAGFIHGLAIEAMRRMGISVEGQESKSWDVFRDDPVDAVITLCDAAAAETCPQWPGAPLTAHWSLPDPAYHPGAEEERMELAMRVADRLRLKIEGLVNLDWSADRQQLAKHLNDLGEI